MRLFPPDPSGGRGGEIRRAALGFCLLCLLSAVSPRQAVAETPRIIGSACEQAGREAERQFDLPVGLLAAIGRVESGRWDATLGRVVPTPWAIDAAGQPMMPESKEAALRQTRALQDSGVRNIDVGCFQINLQHHPAAFTDLDQAFDPAANAQYAARFLTDLRARLGSWEDAVAAYHSSTQSLGVPYRQLVFANWAMPAGAAQRPAPPRDGTAASPVSVFSFGSTQIRVWTPSQAGTAASMVSMDQPTAQGTAPLPRVITSR